MRFILILLGSIFLGQAHAETIKIPWNGNYPQNFEEHYWKTNTSQDFPGSF
jgi:hypothetical protein